jgi:hypothetical protein
MSGHACPRFAKVAMLSAFIVSTFSDLNLVRASAATISHGTNALAIERFRSLQTPEAQTPTVPPHKKFTRYVNKHYGFTFTLPSSWKGYSTFTETWGGGICIPSSDPDAPCVQPEPETSGPKIIIRNPHWTERNPYQDIPIMVFTYEQWKLIEDDRLVVSAAPFGPGEIGRNAKYVFALPPRYNYADAEGIEEVNEIMQSNPLHGR